MNYYEIISVDVRSYWRGGRGSKNKKCRYSLSQVLFLGGAPPPTFQMLPQPVKLSKYIHLVWDQLVPENVFININLNQIYTKMFSGSAGKLKGDVTPKKIFCEKYPQLSNAWK